MEILMDFACDLQLARPGWGPGGVRCRLRAWAALAAAPTSPSSGPRTSAAGSKSMGSEMALDSAEIRPWIMM
jgi:hypothetical protein